MPQFDPTYFVSQVFWLVVSFSLLVGVISGVAVPRIQSSMKKRSQYIQDVKDRETNYLAQINDLTKQMNHLKHEHAEKTRHRLEAARAMIIAEKEKERQKLQELFSERRKESLMAIDKEIREVKTDIPELAQTLIKDILDNLLDRTTTEERKHYVLH